MEYIPCRVFCIGMNYGAHIKEMKNDLPKEVVIFMKPPQSLVAEGEAVGAPGHGKELHHEVEVVVLIGKEGRPQSDDEARSFIAGLSLGLDLTLRDVQRELKRKGMPWEISKAFEQSAPIAKFIPMTKETDLANLEFLCRVNGDLRQHGNSGNMIFPILTLIKEIAKVWTLRPGDMIYTGTPEGVGPIKAGDKITIAAPWLGSFSWDMI
ncbi:MAG: fumarylacetoacetate hydrolase family protein [Candidatus Sumerlaeota bacterium]|nr:fumarylacetoacetate hydrolase family protein [Candidatus Sumerlaeota bacterium]